MSFELGRNEEIVELRPICIRYRCEICHEGEMIADPSEPIVMPLTGTTFLLRKHICNKCGGILQLPKTYPYIEWITEEDYQKIKAADKDYDRLMNAPKVINGEIVYGKENEKDESSEVH